MQNHHNILLLFLFLPLILITPKTTPITPTTPTQQLNNIIDALISAGDFTTWVSILSSTNSTIFPLSATLFVPRDTTMDHPPPDPFLLPFHVVPQRLTFSDLLLLPRLSRLPTLLPDKFISVTDNRPDNFSLNATPLTHPDLFSTPVLAVHGLHNFLDYALLSPPPPPLPPPPFLPFGNTIGTNWNSGASNYSNFPHLLFLLLFCFPLPLLL